MNDRAKVAEHALRILGRDRFIAFIRAVRNDTRCRAIKLMNEALDAGQPLEHKLLDGDDHGYTLSVTQLGPNRYRIRFGYVAGGTAGDGGQWDVTFDEDGSVLSAESGIAWLN